jgi:hypothetical protein
MDSVLLLSRDITATDGAQVNGSPIVIPQMARMGVVGWAVTTTGTPTTYDCRGAIEGSFDGVTWFQLLRCADITNAAQGPRFTRLPFSAAASDATVAASALGSASASAVIVDGPWPRQLRGVSKLQTLTGGTTPHILPVLFFQPMDSAS